jgi:methylaspartate ammonia-lyase
MAKNVAKAVAADSDVEIVSKPGMGIDEGIVLTTFFLLAGAIALVMIANRGYTG